MIEDAGPGVKSKASTKFGKAQSFIEKIAKLPDMWGLVKELSQRKAKV
jgi:hypothetical protein